MGLLQLPGELLDEIITQTIPNGFISFALSCKQIYGRATDQIERHNRLRQLARYAAQPSNDKGKAMYLLYELSRDQLLGQCIHYLNLRDPLAEGSQSETSFLSDEFRMEEDAMEKIKSLVTSSPWLHQAGADVEDWWRLVMEEDDRVDHEDDPQGIPYTVVSLLSQLPMLRSLQLPWSWKEFDHNDASNTDAEKQLLYVLDALVGYSNKGTEPQRCLGSLSTLLPFMPEGYEERAGFQCLEPFLSLNSLRELYGVSLIAVEDSYTGIPFTWRANQHSALRRIELAYCCIDAEGLSSIVQHTPQLEVFRYSHQTKWHGCQHDWNAGAFVSALSTYCGASITTLAITIDELYGDIVNGASSFLSFGKLQLLEVDVRIFCGPPIESNQRKGLNNYVPPGETPWTVHDIPCIGSMAPVSIRNLIINTDYPSSDKQALRSLLKNVQQQKAERLENLQAVTIRQFDGDSAKSTFAIPGLVICVDGNQEEYWPRDQLPLWKRDFHWRVGGVAHM